MVLDYVLVFLDLR